MRKTTRVLVAIRRRRDTSLFWALSEDERDDLVAMDYVYSCDATTKAVRLTARGMRIADEAPLTAAERKVYGLTLAEAEWLQRRGFSPHLVWHDAQVMGARYSTTEALSFR